METRSANLPIPSGVRKAQTQQQQQLEQRTPAQAHRPTEGPTSLTGTADALHFLISASDCSRLASPSNDTLGVDTGSAEQTRRAGHTALPEQHNTPAGGASAPAQHRGTQQPAVHSAGTGRWPSTIAQVLAQGNRLPDTVPHERPTLNTTPPLTALPCFAAHLRPGSPKIASPRQSTQQTAAATPTTAATATQPSSSRVNIGSYWLPSAATPDLPPTPTPNWTVPPPPHLPAGSQSSKPALDSWASQGPLSYDPDMLLTQSDDRHHGYLHGRRRAWHSQHLPVYDSVPEHPPPPPTSSTTTGPFARDSQQDVTIHSQIGAATAMQGTHTHAHPGTHTQPTCQHPPAHGHQPHTHQIDRVLSDTAHGHQPTPCTQSGRRREARVVREFRKVLTLAVPCVVITGSAQVIIVISQVVAGHLGTDALAAAAVGNMLWLLGYYAIIGTCTALETLGAQAVGAGDYGRLVVWDMAAAVVVTLLALPLAGCLWNADALASSILSQDTQFGAVLISYCRGLVPGLLPAVWSIILSKHLQAQSQVLLPALVVGSAAGVYVGALKWLVDTQVQGLPAVSLAASIARAYQLVAMFLAVLGYETYKGAEWCTGRMWVRGVTRWQSARRGRTLVKFLSLAAPGCLGATLDCAGWEVTTAMAAYLGTLQVAVHASALSVATLVIMCVPMALAIAANLRIAKLLGSGHSDSAQACAGVVVCVGTVLTSALGVGVYRFRNQLGWAFTSQDQAIVQLLADIAPLVAVYQGIAGLLGSTQGVLRGVGRQGLLVVHSSVGLGVGTLLGAWLTWGPWDMGLPGLWRGSVAGTAVTALLNLLVLLLVDWPEEVLQARNMQLLQQGVRARRQMIYGALRADDGPDEALVEALLAEAQQDPRPLHIIYQEYAWFRGGSTLASTSEALSRAQSNNGAQQPRAARSGGAVRAAS